MTAALFSGDFEATRRRREALKTVAALAAFTVCAVIGIGGVLSLIQVADNSDRVNTLTSALAAGDKVVKFGVSDSTPYEIQCTGPGQANAFKITIGRDGNRVVTDRALVGYPTWPINRLFGHSVRAGRCDGGVN
jgi:hypothetical protein